MSAARERAIAEQLAASDPAVSAFVEASAGSGKTKLLTDRILRLMLAGAPPAKLQCLTFTKAAAAEMALRLQARLGRWAVIDDAALERELLALRVPGGASARKAARSLFAEVLDLPGGMRIGTIHAFCQSLLRRFPLEAAISPHFTLIEDADALLTMERARESVLASAAGSHAAALTALAGLVKAEQFGGLVRELDAQRERLTPLLGLSDPALVERVFRAAGAPVTDEEGLLREACAWPAEGEVRAALQRAEALGSAAVKARLATLLDWLALPVVDRVDHWDTWWGGLFTNEGTPRKAPAFVSKKIDGERPEVMAVIGAEQARVLAVEQRRLTVRTAAATIALLRLGLPVLRAYGHRKGELGQLDYSDLIGRTSELLRDPGAAWVLYKLDGGIDHLLLDEVQDTAPAQWRIAHRLTEEFFAGQGVEAGEGMPARTFFAVGDPKQSIYSFQGADRDEFTRSRLEMAYRVEGSKQEWRNIQLDVSFRSTAPVLALVDAVFAAPPASQGVAETLLQHYPDREGDAGRVELWPLAPVPVKDEVDAWTPPDANRGLVSAPQRLAEAIASWVADALKRGERLESQDRALDAGDVLILVRRRTDFARSVVRALKGRGVAVAGLDRLVLTEQAAVQDVLAACDAVLLPEDDLAVGCVLTGPLGGLSQDSLMALALGRPRTLFAALRQRAGERAEWGAAWAFLDALSARADHVTPHALLVEMLGALGGRARLLARLGPEAAEPLDELLGAALDYATRHPPSLQGFVHWLRRSGATIKREAGGAGGAVRVMTVHGAKGLQAPVVILPDTTALPPEDEKFAWVEAPEPVPLWAPRKEFRSAVVERQLAATRIQKMQEHNRLLYVALTRAEDRLIVCGWETRRGVAEESWYRQVRRGFEAVGARAEPFTPDWGAPMLVADCAQERPPTRRGEAAVASVGAMPAWVGQQRDWRPLPPPAEPALPTPLAPSRPDDVQFGPVPRALSPGRAKDRFGRGTLVHELLQHLPAIAEAERADAADAYLRRNGLEAAEAAALTAQVLAVLRHPELAVLFGPASRAEQPITGLVAGAVISGKVDRMAVLPEAVLLVDYKTGREAPTEVARTPVLYLRQMAAYRAVLAAIYPDRAVRCALVWTSGPTVVTLPPALLDQHQPSGGGRGAALDGEGL